MFRNDSFNFIQNFVLYPQIFKNSFNYYVSLLETLIRNTQLFEGSKFAPPPMAEL